MFSAGEDSVEPSFSIGSFHNGKQAKAHAVRDWLHVSWMTPVPLTEMGQRSETVTSVGGAVQDAAVHQ